MIVKVIGRDRAGACLERAAETIDLWETERNLRKLGRELARRYLATWSAAIDIVEIRRDDSHRLIVKVRATTADTVTRRQIERVAEQLRARPRGNAITRALLLDCAAALRGDRACLASAARTFDRLAGGWRP